jgi:type I restriction enzyme, R subunit
MVRDQEKIYMGELIAKLNEIFGSDTSDQDQLVYARHIIMGKLLESELLQQQAANNTKEQFSNSPDLNSEFKNATIASLDAHTTMATQVLNNSDAQRAMLDLLLNQSRLWETLRGQWAS